MNIRIHFYRISNRDPGNDQGRIIMSASGLGQRVICQTGLKSAGRYWDKKTQSFNTLMPDSAGLNAYLASLRKNARDLFISRAIRQEKPNPKEFRILIKKSGITPQGNLTGSYVLFMEENFTSWSVSTYGKSKSLLSHLRSFAENHPVKLTLESMDEQALQSFSNYLENVGLNLSTIKVYMDMLKWFLNWSLRKGRMINTGFRNFRYNSDRENFPGKSADKIFLSWDELMLLLDFESNDRKIERTRDIYCLIALSGIRYSEIMALEREDVSREAFRIGGRRKRSVPQNSFTLDITRKYENRYYPGNKYFPSVSVPTLNKYLGLLAKNAGINRLVPVYDAGKVSQINLPDVFTISSAYHTFTANCIRLGIPDVVSSVWTGKKSSAHYRNIREQLLNAEKRDIQKINALNEKTS